MFFCYRWLLLELKREFPFDDALLMLEVMWSSLPPDPPEKELELADPAYKINKLNSSPSPSLATQAYMRLRARRRQAATPSGDGKDGKSRTTTPAEGKKPVSVPITPMEEEKMDPKDFVPVADDATKELMNKSHELDKALEEPIQCIEPLKDLQKFLNRSSSGRGSELRNKSGSPAHRSHSNSPKHNSHSSNHKEHSLMDIKSEFDKLARRHSPSPNSSGSSSCSNSKHNSPLKGRGSGSPLTIECPGNNVEKDPNVPDSPRRPTDIPLKNTCMQEGPKSVLIHGKDGVLTERSVELTSELNSCEEATESPLIDFSQAPLKLPALPPPHEFGLGNPFLLFLCLTLLLQQRDHIVRNRLDYNDLAMHFDHMVRRHDVGRVLNQAQALYAVYLRAQANNTGSESSGSDDVSVWAGVGTLLLGIALLLRVTLLIKVAQRACLISTHPQIGIFPVLSRYMCSPYSFISEYDIPFKIYIYIHIIWSGISPPQSGFLLSWSCKMAHLPKLNHQWLQYS